MAPKFSALSKQIQKIIYRIIVKKENQKRTNKLKNRPLEHQPAGVWQELATDEGVKVLSTNNVPLRPEVTMVLSRQPDKDIYRGNL